MSSQSNPEVSPQVSDANFIPCEFSCNRRTSKWLIRWLKPAELFVAIQLPGRGAQSSALRGRTWLGLPPDGAALQQKLADLTDLRLGKLADFTLHIKHRARKNVALTWSEDEETKQLADLRQMLEKVGHFRYAEALAYGRQGDELGRTRVYGRAIQSLRTGLEALGERYWSEDLRDDTGLYLLLAQTSERAGQMDAAWSTYNTVLSSRLGAYQRLHGVVEKA
jgi:hypothetical protein